MNSDQKSKADTSTPASEITASAAAVLKNRFDGYSARTQTIGEALEAAIPVTASTPAQQEAFLLTLSDVKRLQSLLKDAENMLNLIRIDGASAEELDQADTFIASMQELAQNLVMALSESFGVSPDLVIPVAIKDLERLLDLIEMIVVRAESSLKEVTA